MVPPIFMIDDMCSIMLEQAHDLLNTAETVVKMAKAAKCECVKIKNAETQGGVTWIESKNDMPVEGDRVVIDTGECEPYFLTYFKSERIKFNRWLKLPE